MNQRKSGVAAASKLNSGSSAIRWPALTVAKYMRRRSPSPSPTWRRFLEAHLTEIAAIDFFMVPTLTFRLLFGFIVLRHDRRELGHVNVTTHPTATWTARQVIDAFPYESAPTYVLRDRGRDLW